MSGAAAKNANRRLRVAIQYARRQARRPGPRALGAWARAALASVGAQSSQITIRITDRGESAALNGRYRKRPHPTNVLSFGYDGATGTRCVVGDLVICGPLAREEAVASGVPERAHWAHLVIHGIMHLCGHDHEADREARRMERLESRVMKSLGFSDPYHR